MTDDEMELEIINRDLTAPRVTPQDIEDNIVGEEYYVFPGNTMTVCLLTLKNGFTVTGESACVSHENFDAEIGQDIARDKAKDKIWSLMGYELAQRLHEGRE